MSLQRGHNEYCPEAYAPEPRGQVWVECPTCRSVWEADWYEEWEYEHDSISFGGRSENYQCTNPDCDGEDGNQGEEIDAESLTRYIRRSA